MTKRVILREFKLTEISAVDRPAQVHAKMTIMKRDGGAATMTNVNIGALAQFALECKANELRKAHPEMSEATAFAKVYTDPANREIAEAERRANRPTGLSTEQSTADRSVSIAKRDTAMDALTAKGEEIRKAHPHLTPEQAFAKAYYANVGLQTQERAAARTALYGC